MAAIFVGPPNRVKNLVGQVGILRAGDAGDAFGVGVDEFHQTLNAGKTTGRRPATTTTRPTSP
ncbi:MAG: hypothetical protein ACE5FD_10540, partial [Anaerolineae bacterium]